jgi:hypothetical protein
LLGADRAAAQQALAEPVDALIRRREDDLARMQVDGLRALRVLEVEEAGLGGRVEELEQVGQRERAHVGAEHQLTVERERRGIRSGALEQDRARRRRQHAQRLELRESQPLAQRRRELALRERRCTLDRNHSASFPCAQDRRGVPAT